MKKILIIVLLTILFFDASAQLKFSGTFRFRGNTNKIANFPNYDVDSYPWSAILTKNTSNSSTWSTDSIAYFTPNFLDSLASEDNLPMENYFDIRFRPKFEYQVNKNLKAVWVAEIGDLKFGDASKGVDQGADGVNIETKSLYFDWSFYKGHTLRTGIQNYMDPMVMIVEDDFAGITLESNWRELGLKELTTKIGWLKGLDNGQGKDIKSTDLLLKLNDETYFYGYSNYIFDVKYALNRNNFIGLNGLYQNYTEDVSDPDLSRPLFSERLFKTAISGYNLVNYNKDEIWIAPYFKGRPFYELSVEAEFVYNSRTADFDIIQGELADSVVVDGRTLYSKNMDFLRSGTHLEDGSGYAFMLKTNYKATEDLDLSFNFLYSSGDELSMEKDSIIYTNESSEFKFSNNITKRPEDYYHGASDFSVFSSKTRTGLEILGTNGICDSRGLNPTIFGDYFGAMLPVISANYKLTKDHTVGISFGSAYLATEVNYATFKENIKDGVVGNSFKTIKRSNYLGSEFDLTAKLNFNNLCIQPVAAFFFPGDLMQISSTTAKAGHAAIISETDKAPMMYEIGLKAEFRF